MCNCVDILNKELAAKNAAIVVPLVGPQRTFVEMYKLDEKKRGRIPALFAARCPFCGEKYPKE